GMNCRATSQASRHSQHPEHYTSALAVSREESCHTRCCTCRTRDWRGPEYARIPCAWKPCRSPRSKESDPCGPFLPLEADTVEAVYKNSPEHNPGEHDQYSERVQK